MRSIPPDTSHQIFVSIPLPLFCHMGLRAKVRAGAGRFGSRAPFSREMQAGLGDASMAMFRRATAIFAGSRLSVNRLSWGVRTAQRSLRPFAALDKRGHGRRRRSGPEAPGGRPPESIFPLPPRARLESKQSGFSRIVGETPLPSWWTAPTIQRGSRARRRGNSSASCKSGRQAFEAPVGPEAGDARPAGDRQSS